MRELRADAVAGDECHGVLGHACVSPFVVVSGDGEVRRRARARGCDCLLATALLGSARDDARCAALEQPLAVLGIEAP